MNYSQSLTITRLVLVGWICLTQSCQSVPQRPDAGNGTPPAAPRPNMVLFITDDHGYEDSGFAGNKVVRTPVLDQLAKESMRFTHAFANTPTCVPSRAVLYSGLMPARNGAHPNHSKVRDDLKTLPHYLQALGYRVMLAGKTHIEPMSAYPFEYFPVFDNPQGKSFVEVMHDLNQEELEALISSLAKEPADKPFCLVVASYAPHVQWPEPEGYSPDGVPVPPYLADTPETRYALAQYYTEISTDMEQTLGTCLSSLKKNNLEDNTLFVYTSDQGRQFPFAKWNLYDAGIRTPFLVRWPGKVRGGTVSEALISQADLLPTFIEVAGGEVPPALDGRSYLPVLLGQQDAHHEAVYATHTADTKYGNFNYYPMRSVRTRDFKYILNLTPATTYTRHITKALDGSPWPSWLEKAKTDPKAAYLVRKYQHRPAEELYDLRQDPYELTNLAAEPAQQQLLESLRGEVMKWMEQQNDQDGLTLYYTNVKFASGK